MTKKKEAVVNVVSNNQSGGVVAEEVHVGQPQPQQMPQLPKSEQIKVLNNCYNALRDFLKHPDPIQVLLDVRQAIAIVNNSLVAEASK